MIRMFGYDFFFLMELCIFVFPSLWEFINFYAAYLIPLIILEKFYKENEIFASLVDYR